MATLLKPGSPRVALNAYKRIAAAWRLDMNQSATLLGISQRTLHRWLHDGRPDHSRSDTLERISHLVAIWEGLAAIFGRGEVARSWVTRPNDDFGGQPPLKRMLHGNVQDLLLVRTYLDRARQGW